MYIEQGVLLLQIHQLIQQDQAQDLHDLLQIQRNMRNRRRRQRSVWVRPWLLRREAFGHYNVLMQELATESESDFINFMRMDPRMFAEVVERVTPRIQRQDTNFRRALEPGLKVAVTLRHFASGQSYRGMAYNWRVAHNTISKFIKEVSDAIVAEYAGEVVVLPATPEEWQVLADQFGARWNFSHAIGANMSASRSPPTLEVCSTITNTTSPSSSWPSLMRITSSCTWRWELMVHAQTARSLTSVS